MLVIVSCVAGLGDITDAMVILPVGAPDVVLTDNFGAVPGLMAIAGTQPDGLEADDGVGGPDGEEAEVDIERSLGRGAMVGPEDDCCCDKVSDVAGDAAIFVVPRAFRARKAGLGRRRLCQCVKRWAVLLLLCHQRQS